MPPIDQTQPETLLTICGAIICLAGWMLFRVGTRLGSLSLGGAGGVVLAQVIAVMAKLTPSATAYGLGIGALVGALLGLWLVNAAEKIVLGTAGLLAGLLAGKMLAEVWTRHQGIEWTWNQVTVGITLGTATACGIAAVWLRKLVIMALTSYVGGTMLVASLPALKGHEAEGLPIIFAFSVLWQVVAVRYIFKMNGN